MVTADGAWPSSWIWGSPSLLMIIRREQLTRTRQFVGTLRYASPEQVLAVERVDRRSDIYSLGATLWELLTLQPIYDATEEMSTLELMRRIESRSPWKHTPIKSCGACGSGSDRRPLSRKGSCASLCHRGRAGRRFAAILCQANRCNARPIGTGASWRWTKRHPRETAYGSGLRDRHRYLGQLL